VPRIRGGTTLYGLAVGILVMDTRFPRPPGDVGNATTWPFPVRYRIVKGAEPRRVIGGETDPTLLEPFAAGARELEAEGVRAITTTCGFLSIFQRELAAAVRVPVLSSSLLQVPLAARVIRPDQKVAILTGGVLTERHFAGAGWSPRDLPVVVSVLPSDSQFVKVYYSKVPEPAAPDADTDVLAREILDLATRTMASHPDVGAFVLECTNFVPYGQAIRRTLRLPVFDVYTLVTHAYQVTAGTDFARAASFSDRD
jgi:hypothetical protein